MITFLYWQQLISVSTWKGFNTEMLTNILERERPTAKKKSKVRPLPLKTKTKPKRKFKHMPWSSSLNLPLPKKKPKVQIQVVELVPSLDLALSSKASSSPVVVPCFFESVTNVCVLTYFISGGKMEELNQVVWLWLWEESVASNSDVRGDNQTKNLQI